ncbi:DUF6325 family protein [Citricoccus sp.]|uniref:DUF6325 family protein n=1 Tax=Citricoccus sp. TaxID=1978372 RepID=UPI002616D182|nr:DUF6325 family protein [Citricoccus sp.]HRO31490.1 DUF6325 family protein [Citricoccus sp.]HRO94964.1 DUF6325 family protein [Citricoccus sp.]
MVPRSSSWPGPLGPVEFLAARLVEARPDPDLLRRLSELVRAGGVRVLDFVVASRTAHGRVSWSDVDAEEFSLAGVDLLVPGMITEQDIREVLAMVTPGGWAIILVEHTWSSPERQFRHPGAMVVPVAHVPAAAAEAALEAALSDQERTDDEDPDDGPA